jgi:undecaprenyl-diphosphatase
MYALDASLTQLINNLSGHSGVLDWLFMQISAFGVPLLILSVALQWWRGGDRLEHRHVLLMAGFSFLLGELLNQIILLFVHRARPYESGLTHLLIDRSADYSFPSDHATAVFAIAFVFMLVKVARLNWWYFVAACVVGFSRVYLGIHFVSDIVGGAFTAWLAVMIVNAVFKRGSKLGRLLTGIL